MNIEKPEDVENEESAVERSTEFPPEAIDREGIRIQMGQRVEIHMPQYFGTQGRVLAWTPSTGRVLVMTAEPPDMLELEPQTFTIRPS